MEDLDPLRSGLGGLAAAGPGTCGSSWMTSLTKAGLLGLNSAPNRLGGTPAVARVDFLVTGALPFTLSSGRSIVDGGMDTRYGSLGTTVFRHKHFHKGTQQYPTILRKMVQHGISNLHPALIMVDSGSPD